VSTEQQPKAGQIWNIMLKRHPDRINCQLIIQRVESGTVYASTLKKGIRMEATVAQWNEWTRTRSHILASEEPAP
jgi:hypothetical protein